MRSLSAVVAAAVGAAVAVIALIGPTAFFVVDSAGTGSRFGSFFDSSAAVAAAAVVVALLVASVMRNRAVAVVGAAVGLIALAVLAFTVKNGQGIGYSTAIAAGLVLGALAVMTQPDPSIGGRAGRIGLAAGVVAGSLLAQALPSTGGFGPGTSRRYADYLPGDLVSTEKGSGLLTVVGVIVAVIALAALALQIKGTTTGAVERPDATVAITGLGIAVAIVLVSGWSVESRSPYGQLSPPGWVFGSLLVVIVLAVALVLPGRTGLAWVGVVALVAAGAVADLSGINVVVGVVVTVLIGLGAASSGRRNLLPLGIAVLVVVALLQLSGGDSSTLIAAVAAVFVAPFAVSYTAAVCVSEPSSSQPLTHPAIIATALAACVPLSAVGGGADFGWTAYTPLTDARSSHLDLGFGYTSGTTVTTSVLSLIAAGVVAWVITRRPVDNVPEAQ
ncbi:hypothetical protein [Williamsia phyllosphaerae]|uniref:MFS transporter n=1 Tax=Williamsia phyllosphaerae TaxID=885042 RepID=A0ABQ1UCG1_9NOCA|nr:hypothetical protein [Williamsia phyllosphaerae]GGF15791.1 hypothetical protein GCM10007298_09760 [Williamsia phyllosphaerae]